VRRWLRALAGFWERARHEHATPREIGWAVAAGVFSGCTPFVGLHLGIAVGLATLLRLNRLWAALGSRVSFTPLLAGIAFSEIELAHRVRTGAWVPLAPHEALLHGKELLVDWMLGSVPVGALLAGVLGLVARAVARRAPRRAAPTGDR
jgi:uncharacterized protein (DUF2062 family)